MSSADGHSHQNARGVYGPFNCCLSLRGGTLFRSSLAGLARLRSLSLDYWDQRYAEEVRRIESLRELELWSSPRSPITYTLNQPLLATLPSHIEHFSITTSTGLHYYVPTGVWDLGSLADIARHLPQVTLVSCYEHDDLPIDQWSRVWVAELIKQCGLNGIVAQSHPFVEARV